MSSHGGEGKASGPLACLKGCLSRCLWQLVERTLNEDDNELMILRKKTILLVAVVASMCSLIAAYMLVTDPVVHLRFQVGSYLALLMHLFIICYLFCRKPVTDTFLLYVTLGYTFIVMNADLNQADQGLPRQWPLIIIVVDLLLVMQADRLTGLVVGITLTWLLVTQVEETARFGLYNIPYGLPEDMLRERLCGCSTLPCATSAGHSLGAYFLMTLVFLLDVAITRGFAHEMREKQKKIEATVAAADALATALAQLDLETADAILKASADSLPPAMHAAFGAILHNLNCYRPYIPNALFDRLAQITRGAGTQRGVAPRRHAPGSGEPSPNVAVVFTDIKGSTATWEAEPEGMKRSLRIHNDILRECIDELGGYEVKTIGDAFMVAFDNVSRGIAFGLTVQERLAGAEWPASLLALPNCAPQPGNASGGLSLRIGVNSGPVSVEMNAVTGRADYFGQTVNKASRLEGVCIAGTVAVSHDIFSQLVDTQGHVYAWDTMVHRIGDVSLVCVPMGPVQLRGVSGKTEVYALMPATLRERSEHALRQVALLQDGNVAGPVPTRQGRGTGHSAVLGSDVFRRQLDQETVATVGRVAMHIEASADVDESVNATLQKMVVCLERSDGRLISLVGSSTCVGWNTAIPCIAHVESSFRFVCLLDDALARAGGGGVSIGLSTGPVVFGNVGTTSQRFLTVLGECTSRSELLCIAAKEVQVMCLYMPCRHDTAVRLERYLELSPTKPAAVSLIDGDVYTLRLEVVRSRLLHLASDSEEMEVVPIDPDSPTV